MPTDKIRMLVLTALAVSTVAVLAGCTGGAPAGEAATPAAEKPAASASVETPTLSLVEPADGSTVPAGDLKVNSEVENLKFTMPSNTNVPGEGHIHYTLDDRPFEMSVEPGMVIKDVEPGEHTLEAELVQNNTQPFDPPIKQTITFTAE